MLTPAFCAYRTCGAITRRRYRRSCPSGCGERGLLVVGGASDDDTGPGAEVDPLVVRELVPRPRFDRIRRQRFVRGPDERTVGRAEVLDVPAVVVERQLRVSVRHG